MFINHKESPSGLYSLVLCLCVGCESGKHHPADSPVKDSETKTDKFAGIEYMSEDAVQAVMKQPDVHTRQGVRDQFFMILLYDTAARIQEMLDLKVCDIRRGKAPTATLMGKGSKVRSVPLMPETMEHFQNYINVFHSEENQYSSQPLFYVERHGNRFPMSDDNVRKFLQKYGDAARRICPEVPENIHPHLWRHSRAMHLYQHGMDLTLISQWLGHVNLETSLIYAMPTQSRNEGQLRNPWAER